MPNNVNSLLSQLSQSKKTRLIGGNTTITNLVVPLSFGSSSSKSSALGRLSDIRAFTINGAAEAKGIQFGGPSSTRTSSPTTQSGWSNVLTQVATNGAANTFRSALGSIGGLGSLISGIFHMFSGGNSKASLPPLVRFQLPSSQTETAYIGSQSRTVLAGAGTQQSIRSTTQPIYAPAGTQKSATSSPVYDTAAITQAVKQALLNSSSLNDVIAEI